MALSERLAIIISANGAQAMAEFNKVGKSAERSLATTEQRAQRLGAQFTRVGAGAVVFGAVLAAGMYKAAQAAGEQEAANLRLENTMANQPALAGASAQAFYDQASALQLVTRFGDEATVSAQAMLGQFGLTQDQIMELIPLVQDYAAKSGTDLVTAARNVGKSVSGTNTTLKRAGVQFDATAYAADHFAGTLAALQGYAGGFAEQEGQTLAGQIEILKNRFGEIAEAVGGGAADAFSDLAAPVGVVADALNSLDPATQNVIGRVLTFGSVGMIAGGGLLFLAGQAMRVKSLMVTLGNTVMATRVQLWYLAASETAAGSAALGMLGPLAKVAAAVGVGYFVLKDYVESLGEVETSSDAVASGLSGMAGAFDAGGSSADGYAAVLNEVINQQGPLAEVLATSGTSAQEFLDIVTSADPGTGLAAISAAYVDAGGSADDAQWAVADFQARMDDVAKAAIEAAVVTGGITRGMADAAYAATGGAGAAGDFSAALDLLAAQNPDAFRGLTSSAQTAEQAIADLQQEIRDYLDGVFDIPEAQRELRESFDQLWAAVADPEHTADDTAAALQGIAEAAGGVVSAGGPANETLLLTVGRLRDAKNAGMITREEFQAIRDAVLGIPPGVSTTVTTPGGPEAEGQATRIGNALLGIPPTSAPLFSTPGAPEAESQISRIGNALLGIPQTVDINLRVNTGSLYADVAGAAAALRSLRTAGGESGVGGGPRRVAGGSGLSMPVVVSAGSGGGATGTAVRQGSAGVVNNFYAVSMEQMMAQVPADQRARVRRRMLAGAR